MIELKSLTLHNPIFLARTNLGVKLETTKEGLKLYRTPDHYVVTYKGVGKFIEKANVADAEPVNVADLGLKQELGPTIQTPTIVQTAGPVPRRGRISHTAQVADPSTGVLPK